MNIDWLTSSFSSDAKVDAGDVAIRLVASLCFGMAIAGIYRLTRGPQVARSSLIATLALLTVLIAMTTVVIGDNIARAFSVVGALSIVRFRTIVEDTRDTAFVIFAVGVGLAVGAGYLVVPLVGLPIVFVTAFYFHRVLDAGSVRSHPGHSCRLRVRVEEGFDGDRLIREALAKSATKATLLGIGTAREGIGVRETYEVAVTGEVNMRQIVESLLRIKGVLGADVEREL